MGARATYGSRLGMRHRVSRGWRGFAAVKFTAVVDMEYVYILSRMVRTNFKAIFWASWVLTQTLRRAPV